VTVFARKISRAKWGPKEDLGPGEIAADAVTVDLRTTGNALSFWTCTTPTPQELKETVLALATNAERLDRFDVAWLTENEVLAQGLAARPTLGDTPIAALRDRHIDVEKLDYDRLGRVARLIVAALANDQHRRMSKKEVLDLVVDAVRGRKVSPHELKAQVRVEVEEALGGPP
jgi:hypothetical protein